MARSWPTLRVVGIDPWEPAPRLARKNLAQSGLDGRVELSLQRIEQIDDDAVFTLARLPGAFIAAETVVAALERVYKALVAGGWLVFGALCATAKCAGRSTHQFANLRGGGHPWTTNQAEEQLHVLGFEGIETLSPSPAVLFVLGQRPNGPK